MMNSYFVKWKSIFGNVLLLKIRNEAEFYNFWGSYLCPNKILIYNFEIFKTS